MIHTLPPSGPGMDRDPTGPDGRIARRPGRLHRQTEFVLGMPEQFSIFDLPTIGEEYLTSGFRPDKLTWRVSVNSS
ncbi:hypothetical protein TA3x_005077 [Tundrisphaera sp. TA3]|uniref:hypothetical protein n=1 Tax=Tundrisphaera sp. TA3 TaxID=3435775 RepID=UPI003EC0CE72